MRGQSAVAKAFEDPASYESASPGDAYLQRQLEDDRTIVLAALEGPTIVGALVAYLLPKLEQERSEIYIYDLAVAEEHRRRGIASAMIDALGPIAAELGAWVIRAGRLWRRAGYRALREARHTRRCHTLRHCPASD